jgi:hypothetical protein
MNCIANEAVAPTRYVTEWKTWAAHLETNLPQSVHGARTAWDIGRSI